MGIFFNKKEKSIQVEFRNAGVDALKTLGEITNRSDCEVILDALKTYGWILEQQTAGNRVGILHRLDIGTEITNLVANVPAAKKYFSSTKKPDGPRG